MPLAGPSRTGSLDRFEPSDRGAGAEEQPKSKKPLSASQEGSDLLKRCSAMIVKKIAKVISPKRNFLRLDVVSNGLFVLKRYGINFFLKQVLYKLKSWPKKKNKILNKCIIPGDENFSKLCGYLFQTERGNRSRKVAIYSSSCGNFFMREIAILLADGMKEIGCTAALLDENKIENLKDFNWIFVVAPHEFFVLGRGKNAFKKIRKYQNVLFINTEQGQTEWFRTGFKFFKIARAVLDINYQMAQYISLKNKKALFFPLGYSALYESHYRERKLPQHDIFSYLSQDIRECECVKYSERPIDILFIGTASRKRLEFFARNADFFSKYNTFFYLPNGDAPFKEYDKKSLNFEQYIGIVRRSKIILNIHRDEEKYLEWQRIVSLGILQKTLVVSESCGYSPIVEENKDYIACLLDELTVKCKFYLDNIQMAEEISCNAYVKFVQQYPLSKTLKSLFNELESVG